MIANGTKPLFCLVSRVVKWTETVPVLMSMKADQDDDPDKENDPLEDGLDACATFNNERGDDYQEQIGMPDEENMRQWSHHHSSDTVDDPVFRAAMRGTDAVSFVFGLEVTWSLIQQRQQDEEDKKAMEAIQEVGEDGFVCAAAGAEEVDEDNAFIVDDEASSSDEDEGAAMQVDNAEVQEGQVDNPSGDDSSCDEDKSPVLSPQESDDQSTVPSLPAEQADESSPKIQATAPEVEILDTSQSQDDDDSSSSIVEAVLASQAPSENSGASSSQASVGKNEWECSTCTLFNKKGLRKCGACGTKRPNSGTKRPKTDVV
jgi:hypothetical protein